MFLSEGPRLQASIGTLWMPLQQFNKLNSDASSHLQQLAAAGECSTFALARLCPCLIAAQILRRKRGKSRRTLRRKRLQLRRQTRRTSGPTKNWWLKRLLRTCTAFLAWVPKPLQKPQQL
jgi:hypothetical protein